MTDRRKRRPTAESATRRYNALLDAECLSLRARRDPACIAKEEAAYVAERRYAWVTRRRPGYVSVEARQPFEAETRLIRREDEPDANKAKVTAATAGKLTYAEMRAQREEYPGKSQAVLEYERRRSEQIHERRRKERAERKSRKI